MKIETERLILRKPLESDLEEYYNCLNDFDTLIKMKDFPWPLQRSYVQSKINSYIKEWEKEKPEFLIWFVTLKSNKKIIGDILIHSINRIMDYATTGSFITKEYRKQYYITEAKIALNDFAFNKLQLKKLISDVFADNFPSNQAQKKLGYEFLEKKIKWGKSIANNQKHDINFYELTQARWENVRTKIVEELKENIKKLK